MIIKTTNGVILNFPANNALVMLQKSADILFKKNDSRGREKYVSEFVSKSGINTRFYLISHRYVWYGYPS